jgi:hypothetical protein
MRTAIRTLVGAVVVALVAAVAPATPAAANTPARLEVIGGAFHVRAGVTASLRIGASGDQAFLAAVGQASTRIVVSASVPLVRRRDVAAVARGAGTQPRAT